MINVTYKMNGKEYSQYFDNANYAYNFMRSLSDGNTITFDGECVTESNKIHCLYSCYDYESNFIMFDMTEY